jgi:hypothetical protein
MTVNKLNFPDQIKEITQQIDLFKVLTGLMLSMALALAFLPEHNQHRLHMPDPWSYEVAATQFIEGKWVLTDDEMAAIRTQARILNAPTPQYIHIGEDAWAFRQAAGHPFEMIIAQWLWHPRLANALLAVLATLALYPLLAISLALLGKGLLSPGAVAEFPTAPQVRLVSGSRCCQETAWFFRPHRYGICGCFLISWKCKHGVKLHL